MFKLMNKRTLQFKSILHSIFCLVILRPSINGLVTNGITKLCCRGFILALFQSITANKIDSEHTRDYKRLLSECEAKILQVTVKRNEVFSSFYVYIDLTIFGKKCQKYLKMVPRFLADIHKDV